MLLHAYSTLRFGPRGCWERGWIIPCFSESQNKKDKLSFWALQVRASSFVRFLKYDQMLDTSLQLGIFFFGGGHEMFFRVTITRYPCRSPLQCRHLEFLKECWLDLNRKCKFSYFLQVIWTTRRRSLLSNYFRHGQFKYTFFSILGFSAKM